MSTDDLSAPLGQTSGAAKRPGRLGRLWPRAWRFSPAWIVAGALSCCLLGVVVWAAVVDDPLGGEPMAVAAVIIKGAAPDADAGRADSGQNDAASKTNPAAAAEPAIVAAAPASDGQTQTVTIIDGSSGKRQEVVVAANGAARPASVDPRLLETTRHGSLPRIAPDGTRVAAAYARPFPIAPGKENLPKIAIVVGGLGISSNGTAQAFSKLPSAITFAFAPYGGEVAAMAARARGEGREFLLQVPMEPFDFPDNDPGPQTLLTSLASDQNIDRLQWSMSRFVGYVGVANYMGARFTSSEAAFSPVMREVAKRGLLVVDDGSSPRSIAGQLAGANGVPFAKSNLVIDAVPTTADIDRALARLEALARETGSAVGFATALPGAVERIARWAKTVEGRGFLLAPVSAVATKPKSS